MKRSLRWQFIIPLLLFFALTFAAMSLFLSRTFLSIYENHLRDTLIAETTLLIDDLEKSTGFPASVVNLQSETERFAGILQARTTIIRADGVVLSDSEANPLTMENHLYRPEVQQALAGNNGYQVRFSNTLKAEMLYVAIPVYLDGKVVVVVRMARSLASIESELAGLNKAIFVSGILALFLLVGITYLIFNKTTHPLTQLTEATKELSTGNVVKVPVRKYGNEIDQLALAFNAMSTQINEQFETLRNEKGKLSSILEQMQDGVVIVNDLGVVQSINPTAERMFGVKQSEVIGRQLIQSLNFYQVSELFEKTLKADSQTSEFIDLQQRHLYLQAIGSIMQDPAGNSVLLLFQDISKQRQVEVMRKDFVSNVSHELRTPLASLRALSETLQSGAVDDPPTAKHFIELMETEIAKLTQMVDELLALSRIESGRLPMKRELVKVKELIAEPVARMALLAQRAGINLLDKCTDAVSELLVDKEQIDQVLINLIHNAIKFTQPAGTVSVNANIDNGTVVFQVKDTGEGIPEEDLDRIFERFFKADRARATKGTGLGLSIARHVVESHGGRIWVQSTLGEGSTFYFSIPTSNPTN
jgi:two-component system phosphate regulon sensor histidine kinase PhoR